MDQNFLAADLSQRRNLASSLQSKRASNTFGRTKATQGFEQQRFDATKNYRQQAPRFTSSYASRGLGSSGVYRRGLERFTGNYADQMNSIDRTRANSFAQFDMNDRTYIDEYNRAIGELDLRKQAHIDETAAGINGLRSQIG